MKSQYKTKNAIFLLFIFLIFTLSCEFLFPRKIVSLKGTLFFDTTRNIGDSYWDLKMWTQVPTSGYNLNSDYTFTDSQITINLILKHPGEHAAVDDSPEIEETTQSLDISEGNYSLLFSNEGNTDTYDITITSYTVTISTVGTPIFTCPADYENRVTY